MFSLKALRVAATELNDVMGLKPPIDTEGKIDDLVEGIKDAVKYIDPKLDHFKESTQTIIDELGAESANADDDPEEDPEEDDNDGIIDQINDAEKLAELKEIAKANDMFKAIRGKLSSFKTIDILREAMLNIISPVASEDDEDVNVNPDREEEEDEPEEPVIPKRGMKKSVVIIPPIEDEDDEEPVTEEVVKKKLGLRAKGSGTIKYFDHSAVVKGLILGSEVSFITSHVSKVSPGKAITGKVTAIKMDTKKSAQEFVKIETKLGVFYKTSKSVELVK